MRITYIFRIAQAVIATLVLAGTAHAQLFRTYLSPTGNDANPCNLAAPCRLLPAALTAVAAGGEIWMLGSANYNTATVGIAKSVSILAVPGVVGSVVATGGPAISIATAGVNVALRNLVVAPLPGTGGTDGVNMTNGASLTIDGCLVANLAGIGVSVNTAARVRIIDSIIRDNASHGVSLASGPTAEISNSKLLGNGGAGAYVFGITAATTTTAAISDSVISENFWGIDAFAPTAGAPVYVSVTRSTISNNAFGIVSDANTTVVTASNNLVTRNSSYGLAQLGSAILESMGNNTVRQNGVSDVLGTIATVSGI